MDVIEQLVLEAGEHPVLSQFVCVEHDRLHKEILDSGMPRQAAVKRLSALRRTPIAHPPGSVLVQGPSSRWNWPRLESRPPIRLRWMCGALGWRNVPSSELLRQTEPRPRGACPRSCHSGRSVRSATENAFDRLGRHGAVEIVLENDVDLLPIRGPRVHRRQLRVHGRLSAGPPLYRRLDDPASRRDPCVAGFGSPVMSTWTCATPSQPPAANCGWWSSRGRHFGLDTDRRWRTPPRPRRE